MKFSFIFTSSSSIHPSIHPSIHSSVHAAVAVVAVSYPGRSLWIWTVWWWLRSLSAAGRWSDLPCRWWSRPHSWESKPSGSTRLPLQQKTGKQEVRERATAVHVVFNYTWSWRRNMMLNASVHYQSVWTVALMPAICFQSLFEFVIIFCNFYTKQMPP